MQQDRLSYLIHTATKVFDISPRQNVILPAPISQPTFLSKPFEVPALWTTDNLRAHWGNLAVVAGDWETYPNELWWRTVARELSIPLIVATSTDKFCIITSEPSEEVTWASEDELALLLDREQKRLDLFSPLALGRLRQGQLSFADLEERIEDGSFSTQLREHRTALDESLENAIDAALGIQLDQYNTNADRTRNEKVDSAAAINATINVSIAYLAARILDDKGYFERQTRENDPRLLLEQTIGRTNGFFRRTYYNDLPHVAETALQQLALHLGNSTCFTLVDHRDVGRLYEHVVQIFQKRKIVGAELGQHYTPITIAEKMLQHLPIEQIRPEERYIFDPAAGSGSLLLAATKRLALMTDVAMLSNPASYLADHVMGNDLDERAHLVSELRYTLMKETLGQQEMFPTPNYFGASDYEKDPAWNLPHRPTIIIANPPFAEDGNVQRAAKFIDLVIGRMQVGDQFAFVLPQTFLGGTTHGIKEARECIAETCRILEVWQCPEGYVGLSARQSTCIITGIYGKSATVTPVARAIFSGAQQQISRTQGYLGQAWLGKVRDNSINWNSVVSPIPTITKPTTSLNNLFYICTGVGVSRKYPPLYERPDDVATKLLWTHKWHTPQTLWANPNNVPANQKYIRYGKDFIKDPHLNDESIYDAEKILVSRTSNRNSREPIAAKFDDQGYCPTNNIFCIVPHSLINSMPVSERQPRQWNELSHRQKLFWLLGILSSELAIDITMANRGARSLTKNTLQIFPLPLEVNFKIIEVVREIIENEIDLAKQPLAAQNNKNTPSLFTQRKELLNQLVEASYGFPKRPASAVKRSGEIPGLIEQRYEQEQQTTTITGQVLEYNYENNQVKLFMSGLDDDIEEEWVSLPQELPAWALDGTVFEAELSKDVETFAELSRRPWSLRRFKHTPRPYLSLEELQNRLLLHLKDA